MAKFRPNAKFWLKNALVEVVHLTINGVKFRYSGTQGTTIVPFDKAEKLESADKS